jgi:hypothetical protein
MKKLLIASLVLACTNAIAADVMTKMVVKVGSTVRLESSTNIYGITDAQAADLRATGNKTLDMASKQQDKGGAYSIEWTWNNEPAIVTPGMNWGAVNAVLHQGTKWLDTHVLKVQKQ